MGPSFTVKALQHQNLAFAGTAGISRENRHRGFRPGFFDRATGSVYISRHPDGRPAPVHILDGLPDELVIERTSSGQVTAIKGTVIAGFVLEGQFYTREQATHMLA
ncbi:MAG: hypothetical protein KDK04_20235 [Candidatus Competibacteraceae bacterium]|nr:hypothetical protein [Candidatus Competibacteraceae bacterium]MCB1814022.1 hypothetical protein [Candidatus Competibacteraceae bacterium]